MGAGYRTHSPQYVFNEIQKLYYNQGINSFEVIDDNFNLDRNRAEQIFDLIIKNNLKTRLMFPNGVRLDLLDRELIDKMKQAGTIQIAAPFDSGSPEIQQRYGRKLNLTIAEDITRYIIQKNIFTVGYFIVGYPDETKEEFKQTISLIQKIPFHYVRFFHAVVFPGTPLAFSLGHLPDPIAEPHRFDYFSKGYGNPMIPNSTIVLAKLRNLLRMLSFRHTCSFFQAHPIGFRSIIKMIAMVWNHRILHRFYSKQLRRRHGIITKQVQLQPLKNSSKQQDNHPFGA